MEVPVPRTPSERQIEALFPEWVGMGAERSYGAVARKNQVDALMVVRHARRFLWPDRLTALNIAKNESASATDPVEGDTDNTNRLHLSRLAEIQAKAMIYLQNATFDSPAAAAKVLVECMKVEREIKGLNKGRDENLRDVLMEQVKNAKANPAPAGVPEFPYDPEMPVESLPDPESDGNEGNPAAPSGADRADERPPAPQ